MATAIRCVVVRVLAFTSYTNSTILPPLQIANHSVVLELDSLIQPANLLIGFRVHQLLGSLTYSYIITLKDICSTFEFIVCATVCLLRGESQSSTQLVKLVNLDPQKSIGSTSRISELVYGSY